MNESRHGIVDNLIEVTLPKPDNFLIVRETLTRIGTVEADGKTVTQLCHILHKQGRYFITHFKELFVLDGETSDFNPADAARRNTIVTLLAHWKLVVPLNRMYEEMAQAPMGEIKVVPHHDKANWNLTAKYQLGKHKAHRVKDIGDLP